MPYTVEEINGCTKKITFNFDSLNLSVEIKQALVEKQKTVNLKGFRKGKAPLTMVEKIYGPQIETDALNNFVQKRLFEAIDEEKLRVVGYPNFENMKYNSGKSVSFDAVVEIFPEVEIGELFQYSFTAEKIEVKDEDFEDLKNNYLKSKAEMTPIEKGSLQKGQYAVLNFEGEKEDGSRPENMRGEEFLLEIGSDQFIPGFEEGMIGMEMQEKKVLELTFPLDYQAEELRGSKVKFHIELIEIKEKNYPELTDELAKEFGFESLEDFNAKNIENLKNQKERTSKEKLHQAILEKLVEDYNFDVPSALIAQQENHLKEDVKKTLSAQGFNEKMMEDYFSKWEKDLTQKAQFQVRSGLILDSLAKRFEVETSDVDFNAKLDEIVKSSGLDGEQIKKYYTSDKRMKDNLMYAIREEKTFKKICEEVQISEE